MLKAEIIGNLGDDAKVMQGNFKPFTSMNVAHQRKFTKQDGTPVAETIWVNVVINWDSSKLLPYLKKGAKVFCRGAVRLRTFTGHDGMTHAGIDIMADDVELCGSPRIQEQQQPQPQPQPQPQQFQPQPQPQPQAQKLPWEEQPMQRYNYDEPPF